MSADFEPYCDFLRPGNELSITVQSINSNLVYPKSQLSLTKIGNNLKALKATLLADYSHGTVVSVFA